MNRETWYELRYDRKGEERVVRFRENHKAGNLQACKERGFKVISCRKLYPFNTMKNQHNFELIYNICWNRIYDMEAGDEPWDDAVYDELEARKERASYFFRLPLPVAWLPYEEWQEATEMATAAVLHRQDACIKAGRPDLVSLC